MKTLTSCLCFLLIGALTSWCSGQDFFNGAGIKLGEKSNQEDAKGFQFLNQGNARPEKRKMEWPRLNLFQRAENSGDNPVFPGNMPRLFQRPEPGKPHFLQGFHNNATEFWGKTASGFSNWARENNSKLKQRTSNAWDNFTRGLSRPFDKSADKGNGPPVRSARNQSNQPRIRF